MQRSRKDQTSFANANGSYNFGDNPSNPYDTGFGLSNALLGVYNTFSQASAYINGSTATGMSSSSCRTSGRSTPRLTLDFGLRAAWYPTAVRLFSAGLHLRSQPLGSVQGAASLPARRSIPATTTGDRPTTRHQHLFAVLRRRPRDSRIPAIAVQGNLPGRIPAWTSTCSRIAACNGVRASALPGTLPASRKLCCAPAAAFTMTASRATASSIPSPILPKRVSPTLNQNLVATIDPKNVLLGPAKREHGATRPARFPPPINTRSACNTGSLRICRWTWRTSAASPAISRTTATSTTTRSASASSRRTRIRNAWPPAPPRCSATTARTPTS